MVINEFKKYTDNLHLYDAEEVDSFHLLNDEELKTYQDKVENSTGNLCEWDHIKAVITFRKKIADLIELVEMKQNTPPKDNRPQGFII